MSRYSSIGKVFAVMSGKGGVGKSTVSALLACEFAWKGKRVGVMDMDITGPSIPTMFGIEGTRPGGTQSRHSPGKNENPWHRGDVPQPSP